MQNFNLSGLIPSGIQNTISPKLLLTSKDRFIYASSSAIYVYKISNNELERVITGHKGIISCIAGSIFFPDIIASSHFDNRINIWNISTGKIIKSFFIDDFSVESIQFSIQNKFSLFVCGKKGVRVYNFNLLNKKYNFINCNKEESIAEMFTQNPKKPDKGVIFMKDGTVFFIEVEKRKIIENFRASSGMIAGFQWDPKSSNYLLIAYKNGEIFLFDTEAKTHDEIKIRSFEKVSGGISSISFISNEPGSFISTDKRTGIIRLWNVSQNLPLKIFRIKSSGITSMKPVQIPSNYIPDTVKVSSFNDNENIDNNNNPFNNKNNNNLNNNILQNNEKTEIGFAIGFNDGTVSIYDWKHKKFKFETQGSHSYTIFDCRFCNLDKDVFGTVSHDGNIKLWDIPKNECVDTIDVGTSLYSLDFHPIKPIVAVSVGNGKVMTFDITQRKMLKSYSNHSSACLRVSWNPIDHKILASTSKDKTCVVFNESGKKLIIYKHPDVVFGISWNKKRKGILATGCFDGNVYIFDINNVKSTKAIKVLSSHKKSVYNVLFHPIIPNILISSSNDKTIRVWDIDSNYSKPLIGHTKNVRALEWSPEIPNVAFSGSWDGTIRVWDVAKQKCLEVIYGHNSDVYGLTIHPKRPFMIGSSSRDSTIRFWSIEKLVYPIFIQSIFKKSLSDFIQKKVEDNFFNIENQNNINNEKERFICKQLSGIGSNELNLSLHSTKNSIEKFISIFDFFRYPHSVKQLWEITKSCIKGVTPEQSEDLSIDSIINYKVLTKTINSLTNEKHSLNELLSKDISIQTAENFLKIGNVKKYCEIMKSIGKWERAISVAPSVSIDYWKELSCEYAEYLKNDPHNGSVPYLVATNQIDKLIDYYISRDDLSDANIVATRNSENGFPVIINKNITVNKNSNLSNDENNPTKITDKMKQIIEIRAQKFLLASKPIEAACCYLSISDYSKALRMLIRGNELLLCYALSQVLGHEIPQELYKQLALKFLKYKIFDLFTEMLNQINNETTKFQILSLFKPNNQEEKLIKEKTYLKVGLQEKSFYEKESQQLESSNLIEDKAKAIIYYSVCDKNDEAGKLAVIEIEKLFYEGENEKEDEGEGDWNWFEIRKLIEASYCIDVIKISDNIIRWKLLAYFNFVGAQLSIWKGYYNLVPCLIKNTRIFFNKPNFKLAISKNYLDYLLCLAYSYANKNESIHLIDQVVKSQNLKGELLVGIKQLKNKLKNNEIKDDRAEYKNIIIPTCSNLPLRSKWGVREISYITGKDAQIPLFLLEDNKTFIGLGEALMWFQVNPFSPICSGSKFNPY